MRQDSRMQFEGIFEPQLKEKIQIFLSSDKTSATLTKALLLVIAMGGVLTFGIAMPGLFRIFGSQQFYNKRSKRLSKDGFYRLRQTFYYLRRKKLIEKISTNKGMMFRLTKKGKKILERFLSQKDYFPVPRYWDKKWRAIFFDIPQTMHYERDRFRYHLKKYDCFPLQKSVWIFPFPCITDVYDIARNLGIEKYVEVYTLVDFDNPQVLNHFEGMVSKFL